MLIDSHLLMNVSELCVQVLMILGESLLLSIKLKTLVFKIITFLDDHVKSIHQGIIDKLIFQRPL